MTTPQAEQLYLQQHLAQNANKGYAIHNPNTKPVEELPVIYGFNNGGKFGWYHAQLIAEDGTGLGSHICSNEAYMPHDLGILEGTRADRHENFKSHYPEGYRMEFVTSDQFQGHKGLNKALELNKAKVDELEQHKLIN